LASGQAMAFPPDTPIPTLTVPEESPGAVTEVG